MKFIYDSVNINWDLVPYLYRGKELKEYKCDNDFPYPFEDYYQDINPSTLYANMMYIVNKKNLECREDLLKKLLSILEENSDKILNSKMFRYSFDFPLGVRGLELKAPWYSGYTQGILLSGLSNLYNEFKSERIKELAIQYYHSFLVLNNKNSFIRNLNGLYWIEEYAHTKELILVLNGNIFGLYGIFEYIKYVNPKADKRLLYAAIHAVKQRIDEYRILNQINLYDMHDYLQDYSPSRTVEQQNDLWLMTGDSTFLKYRDLFQQDWNYANNTYYGRMDSLIRSGTKGRIQFLWEFLFE